MGLLILTEAIDSGVANLSVTRGVLVWVAIASFVVGFVIGYIVSNMGDYD